MGDDGGESGVSLSDESVQMNGEVYCIAGATGVGAVDGMVVGIVPNKMTQAVDIPTLSSDESDEIEMIKSHAMHKQQFI
ncbi:hypothetical protein Tco_1149030 [Tanacetum coccineum]